MSQRGRPSRSLSAHAAADAAAAHGLTRSSSWILAESASPWQTERVDVGQVVGRADGGESRRIVSHPDSAMRVCTLCIGGERITHFIQVLLTFSRCVRVLLVPRCWLPGASTRCTDSSAPWRAHTGNARLCCAASAKIPLLLHQSSCLLHLAKQHKEWGQGTYRHDCTSCLGCSVHETLLLDAAFTKLLKATCVRQSPYRYCHA